MSGEDRGTIEAEIARILLDQWDPLGVRGQPDALERYASYAQHAFAARARIEVVGSLTDRGAPSCDRPVAAPHVRPRAGRSDPALTNRAMR
jgi:hypothetical protein